MSLQYEQNESKDYIQAYKISNYNPPITEYDSLCQVLHDSSKWMPLIKM
jgi:hypothetical protein